MEQSVPKRRHIKSPKKKTITFRIRRKFEIKDEIVTRTAGSICFGVSCTRL